MRLTAAESNTQVSDGLVSLENLLRFQWQIALGEKQMKQKEFLDLLKKYSGIVKLQDQYVYFDEKEIQNLLDKLQNPPEPDSHQLLQAALSEEYDGSSVKLTKQARQLIESLLAAGPVALPEGLQATLRPYQERGFSWAQIGFGSLLADDMGLGKTLQIITLLLKMKQERAFSQEKGLIIVPTTLLTNWFLELQKFAPDWQAHVYHGPGRSLLPLQEADLLITTYGVLRSEGATLQKHSWRIMVIDKAQNIKNPATAQTKAIKKIKAPIKIAMSGTPVENRLSEYWSIFDFTNRGYLGSLKKFKENLANPIEQDRDQESLDRFRKITEPFILRRVKTDKSIIKDLPEKIEKNEYCALTADQAALYQNVLNATLQAIP
ncbi:MAG: hypothetical protein KDC34_12405 [Saprospiraceae bacterium]|nr:hypothetical protein [Saprospiraceae bacterium]